MKTNIALIGLMGAGKSTVGKLLAVRLHKFFVEVDALIEKKAGKPIPRIFLEEGEITFREIEIEVIKEIALQKNQVIACGGGAVLNRINIDRLIKDSVIIWLQASPAAIVKRTGLVAEIRPLLTEMHGVEDVSNLLKTREPFYKMAADFTINTSGTNVNSVAERILKRLE
jgi:shikimate kinase